MDDQLIQDMRRVVRADPLQRERIFRRIGMVDPRKLALALYLIDAAETPEAADAPIPDGLPPTARRLALASGASTVGALAVAVEEYEIPHRTRVRLRAWLRRQGICYRAKSCIRRA